MRRINPTPFLILFFFLVLMPLALIAGTAQGPPLTGNMDVFIKQAALTASASITGVDTLTVT